MWRRNNPDPDPNSYGNGDSPAGDPDPNSYGNGDSPAGDPDPNSYGNGDSPAGDPDTNPNGDTEADPNTEAAAYAVPSSDAVVTASE